MRLVRIDMQVPEHQLKNIPSRFAVVDQLGQCAGHQVHQHQVRQERDHGERRGELPSVNTGEIQDLVQQGFGVDRSMTRCRKSTRPCSTSTKSWAWSNPARAASASCWWMKHSTITFWQIVDEVKQLADVLNSDQGTLGKLLYDHDLYDDLRKTVVERRPGWSRRSSRGKGPPGKLLKDPALYDELQKTVADVHQIIDGPERRQGDARASCSRAMS